MRELHDQMRASFQEEIRSLMQTHADIKTMMVRIGEKVIRHVGTVLARYSGDDNLTHVKICED